MPSSYNNRTGNDTKIWLVTSGGVITADNAKMPTKAWRRYDSSGGRHEAGFAQEVDQHRELEDDARTRVMLATVLT